jgi:hypothetical protein
MPARIGRFAAGCWMCCAAAKLGDTRAVGYRVVNTAQRDRALDSLLVDGLVEQTADGRFALAGEGD